MVKKREMPIKIKIKKEVLIFSYELDALFLTYLYELLGVVCQCFCLTRNHNRQNARPHHLSATVNIEASDITLKAFAKQYLSKLGACFPN